MLDWVRSGWILQGIPESAECLEVPRPRRIGLDLFPDRVDMDVKIVLEHEAIFSPQEGQQLVPGKDPTRLLGQALEDHEFHHGEGHGDLPDRDRTAFGINGKIAY